MDEEDGDPDFLPRLNGITPDTAGDRLGTSGSGPPALAFWVAALRETFEETGILLRSEPRDTGSGSDQGFSEGLHRAEGSARSQLLAGEVSFGQVLDMLDVELDAGGLEYTGHWLTPECELRRYETRFFCGMVRDDVQVTTHEREMVDALWLSPTEALARNREGTLPLILPTVYALEELTEFRTPEEALEELRNKLRIRPVPLRLPRPERVEGGILFHFPG